MENLNDATPAAAESAAPVETTIEETPRGSIDRAFEAAFADAPNEEARVTAEPVAKDDNRDETGRFKAKEGAPEAIAAPETVEAAKPEPVAADAPSRFSPDAKAEWAKTPAPVQSEVKRAVTELEAGLKEYQAKFEPLKPFEEMAKQAGTTIPVALERYVAIDQGLTSQNPAEKLGALEAVFKAAGISPKQYADYVNNQPTDQVALQQDNIIRELRNELAALKQEVNGVSTTIKGQSEKQRMDQIEAFAADNPRFDELADDIALLLQLGKASDLQSAYSMADRLNPAAAAPAPQPKPDTKAQTLKASLSVTGAPASGSNPANRMPPSSARNAVDNAFARLGL